MPRPACANTLVDIFAYHVHMHIHLHIGIRIPMQIRGPLLCTMRMLTGPNRATYILTKRSAKVPKYLYIPTCPHTPISPCRNSRCKNPRSRNSGACHCPGGISPLKNKNRLEWNFPISRFLLLEPGVLTRPRICVPAYLRNSLGFLGGPC